MERHATHLQVALHLLRVTVTPHLLYYLRVAHTGQSETLAREIDDLTWRTGLRGLQAEDMAEDAAARYLFHAP